MGTIKTQAIVLRYADYRENDRMLTLLSPVYGRIDAIARGCKRPKSPLLAASEWFAQGEYVLYVSGGHVTVTSCLLQESFYPIRQDYERLENATYLLSLCEASAQPGQASLGLFKLITRSLLRLAYKDLDPRAVTSAFLLFTCALEGYLPVLDRCVRCQKPMPAQPRYAFDIEGGGLVCPSCQRMEDRLLHLTERNVAWIRDVLKEGVEMTEMPPDDAPLHLLMDYTEAKLECHPPAGKMIR